MPPPDFGYGEAYPGSVVPVVANFAPRQWVPAIFGLAPAWAHDLNIIRSTYNARSETLGEKPSFRHAWQHGQLCIIPAEVLFEPCYETGKSVRWAIRRADAVTACKWHACYLSEGDAVRSSMDAFSRGEHHKAAIVER